MTQRPDVVSGAGGWADDLAQWLWGSVPKDDSVFERLTRRVLNEVHFPCVIFARFPFGLVAVDCNDCDSYQVDDPEIAIYLKLQFNPAHPYKQPATYPFTYIPQCPQQFVDRLPTYRAAYSSHPKTCPAWGRFIAVSLDRFHLAHAMRALGLEGGCYVLCDEGYEDHALDQVSPRRRMPFDDYLQRMNRAMSMVDARGFGDLTHRTIESLAIGIPLIRPKINNRTYDPLFAGVHYLDCGNRGERLADCVEAARDVRVRRALVENGMDWFERNCTPAAVRERFGQILRDRGLPT